MKLTDLLKSLWELIKAWFMDLLGPTPGDPPIPPPTDPPVEPPIAPCMLDFDNLPSNMKIVRVTAEPPYPLREISRMNDSDFPVWGIFGKSVSSKRIKINQAGKLVAVYNDSLKGDGGNYAYEIAGGQVISGVYIYYTEIDLEPFDLKDIEFDTFSSPDRTRLYLLEKHVEDYP